LGQNEWPKLIPGKRKFNSKNMNYKNLLSIVALFIVFHAGAQINKSQYQKIDSLFIEWNQPNHPGGVVGIMAKDRTLFLKAYGLSSLDFLVPTSTETIFNIASVSKQFTAMGIVILDIKGKISVDDDIRKYIPELHDFEETITIRHLLHHTSGLRSLHALLELAGWREDDTRTNEDLYRFMAKQRNLNFTPGDEYLYCNTGYMYMAKIIEIVTGENFTEWMKKSVFEPLGLINTYVEDKYNRIVPQNATSYYGSQSNGFERAVEYWGYVGSGNVHSTTNDLLKWMSNFYDPLPGWEAHFELLQTLDNFNSGELNTYAFGVRIGSYNGIKSIQHGGSIGGFRSNVVTYPEKELSIVILTNFSSSSVGQKINAVSKILLGSEVDEETNSSPKDIKSVKIPNRILGEYEGSYWNDKSNYIRKIYLKDDTLRYFRTEESESPIVPIAKNEFQMLGVSSELIVRFGAEGNDKAMHVTIDDGPPIISHRFNQIESTKKELASYAGKFYSPELETTYIIALNDEKLSCYHPRHGESEIKRIKKDVLEGTWPFNIAKYQRSKVGAITGILVSNGRVRNLWFEKQE
jgi:CubicO group peptidase (beta-lactamase class C family)